MMRSLLCLVHAILAKSLTTPFTNLTYIVASVQSIFTTQLYRLIGHRPVKWGMNGGSGSWGRGRIGVILDAFERGGGMLVSRWWVW